VIRLFPGEPGASATGGAPRSPVANAPGSPVVADAPIIRDSGTEAPQRKRVMDEQAALSPAPKYRRVVLKLSGEGFGYPGKAGISIGETLNIARQVQDVGRSGVGLAV